MTDLWHTACSFAVDTVLLGSLLKKGGLVLQFLEDPVAGISQASDPFEGLFQPQRATIPRPHSWVILIHSN